MTNKYSQSIGEDLNINATYRAVGGDRLEELDDAAMRDIVAGTAIFSRVTPEKNANCNCITG